jgi:HAD superfamily hydrolase (TIGR01484 family)
MNDKAPLPIQSIPSSVCKNLRFLFADIDDTITDHGFLPAAAYTMLWTLYNEGILVVPVTGRPAGWCDHIVRMWPVAGIIGENGAFYFIYDRHRKKMKRIYLLSEEERFEGRKRLESIRSRILREVPRARIAADQDYRITDLAIDYCEDVTPALNRNEIEKIVRIIDEEGATYKVSSIHINCWYGSFNKVECLKSFLQNRTGQPFRLMQGEIIYIGDSPNDEPLFKEIHSSIGVANVKRFLADLNNLPTYITEKESAEGFCEAARIILEKRKNREDVPIY